jgi:hypothetical protein
MRLPDKVENGGAAKCAAEENLNPRIAFMEVPAAGHRKNFG